MNSTYLFGLPVTFLMINIFFRMVLDFYLLILKLQTQKIQN